MGAELEVIDDDRAALRWMLGCLTVIARKILINTLLRLLHAPAHYFTVLNEEQYAMRNGILAGAAALAFTAAFLLISGFRQPIAIAAVTLTGQPESFAGVGAAELDKLYCRLLPIMGKAGPAIVCPIASQVKGYPFEALLPAGLNVAGAILSDQAKSLDWKARKAQFICRVPGNTVQEVLNKLGALLS